jgi:hypothetical protein
LGIIREPAAIPIRLSKERWSVWAEAFSAAGKRKAPAPRTSGPKGKGGSRLPQMRRGLIVSWKAAALLNHSEKALGICVENQFAAPVLMGLNSKHCLHELVSKTTGGDTFWPCKALYRSLPGTFLLPSGKG